MADRVNASHRSAAAWRDEEQRQAQELSDLLQAQINEHGSRLKADGRVPLLNAVAGALVTVTGAMLASVEDRRIRKELRRVMDRGLSRTIAATEGHGGSVQIIRQGRRSDA